MKTLTTFIFVAETSLASAFLGALWLTPWPLMAHISISCAVVLLALTQDFQGLQRSFQIEQQQELNELAFRVLEQRISGQSVPSLSEAYAEHIQQLKLKMIASGEGKAYVMSLLGKYVTWLIGALLCKWLLLPPFITTVSKW